MSLRTGLARQLGLVAETTYGTPVTVTRFLPLVSESLTCDIARIESAAQIAGRQVLDSNQWGAGAVKAGGDVGYELYDRGIGLWLEHAFGDVDTTGSGPYTHTFTPADLAGKSLTTQAGRPDTGGTVRAFTYPGTKVASWEIAWKEGENCTFGLSAIAKTEWLHRVVTDGATTDEDTTVTSATAAFSPADVGSPISGTGIPAGATIASVNSATSVEISAAATATATDLSVTIGIALATASYPSGLIPFRYVHASVTVAGTAHKVTAGKIAGDNKLEERRFGGQATTDEPYGVELRDYSGELEAEFQSLAAYNRFRSGVESALVLTFAAGANSLVITTNVRYDGTTPTGADNKITKQKLPFKCIGSTDANAITAVLVNGDSAA